MNSEFQSLIQTKTTSSKSLKDNILTYLYYWPLFLVSLLIFLGLAYAYLRYTQPKYAANTYINVKGETNMSKGSSGSGDLITSAMNGGKSVINLDNELGRLRSARLMMQVVRNSDLNISYYRQGTFIETDIYHEAPFRLIPKEIQDSSGKIRIDISQLSGQGFTIKYGPENNRSTKTVAWNTLFTIKNNSYTLTPQTASFNGADKYFIEWYPVITTVYELIPKVGVNVIGKTSNIALGITIENAKRGEDVLNKMVLQFIQMNLDDQNKNAQDKIYFIEDRLAKISEELQGVEKNLASKQAQTLMIGGQSSNITGESVAASDAAIEAIKIQKINLNIIRNNINNPSYENVLSTTGVSDASLGGLISSYNEILMKKKKEAPSLTPNSFQLKEMNDQLATLRAGIINGLNSNLKTLDIQTSSHGRQEGAFRSSMQTLPETQRVLGEISREKSIKESLYMYLLQKREETALSKTTTTPYEQIDLATSYGPVSPDKKGAYVYATLIGLILPVAVIFIIGLFNDKISSKDEVENAAKARIVGEISYIKNKAIRILPSIKGGFVGEQFRIMRANLNFLQKQHLKQIILVTSSASGEGKSLISLNIAAVLSKTGKKVALLDFDLRKPDESMPKALNGKGIKDYLIGEASLDEIVQQVGELPALDLYPSGDVVGEAGDLIVSEKVDTLFEELQHKYDTIVINTAPVGLVGDALILQKYSTLVAYVMREGYTRKRHLSFFNSLIESNKFPNTCIIYNGVKTGMKYGYYGYGYAKQNAYFDTKGKNKIINGFKKEENPRCLEIFKDEQHHHCRSPARTCT